MYFRRISSILSLFCGMLFVFSCGNSSTKIVLDENTLIIEPKESSEDMGNKLQSLWTNDEGVVVVLFGYGFNEPSFTNSILQKIKDEFGVENENGLVLPVIFPDDLHNRISSLNDFLGDRQIRGIILLGAPERTHIALAKIHNDWDNMTPFNIFSFFPQDEALGQEGTCNFVVEYPRLHTELSEDSGVIQSADESVEIIMNSIRYVAQLPGSIPCDQDLQFHVQNILKGKKIKPYVDSETGITSVNHFLIREDK